MSVTRRQTKFPPYLALSPPLAVDHARGPRSAAFVGTIGLLEHETC